MQQISTIVLLPPIFFSVASVLVGVGKDGVGPDRTLGCLQWARGPGFSQISSSGQQTALAAELPDSGYPVTKTSGMTEPWPQGDADNTGRQF